jgi:hypothetical protein
MDNRLTGRNHAVDQSVPRPGCHGIEKGGELHSPASPGFSHIILNSLSDEVYYSKHLFPRDGDP